MPEIVFYKISFFEIVERNHAQKKKSDTTKNQNGLRVYVIKNRFWKKHLAKTSLYLTKTSCFVFVYTPKLKRLGVNLIKTESKIHVSTRYFCVEMDVSRSSKKPLAKQPIAQWHIVI